MKKETLEKAAENYGWRIKRNTFSDAVKANELAESAKQDFIEGANWQSKRMYSEEEVIKIVEKSRETGLTAEYLLLTEHKRLRTSVFFKDYYQKKIN